MAPNSGDVGWMAVMRIVNAIRFVIPAKATPLAPPSGKRGAEVHLEAKLLAKVIM
jgi:hypothetical protein